MRIPEISKLPIRRRAPRHVGPRRYAGCALGVLLTAALAVSACQTVKRDRRMALSAQAHNGSGFYVDDRGHMLTNHHVVDDCRRVVVKQFPRPIPAIIVDANVSRDLALLKTEKTPHGHAFFSMGRPLASAESLFALGYPAGRKYGRLGHISGYFKTDNPAGVAFGAARGRGLFEMATYEAILPGNSGGPVMNRSGAIVGMLNAHAIINLNAGYALHGDAVREFLDDNGVAYVTEPDPDAWRTAGKLFSKAESFTFPIVCYR